MVRQCSKEDFFLKNQQKLLRLGVSGVPGRMPSTKSFLVAFSKKNGFLAYFPASDSV
jgi:hypothetical protein